MTNWTTEQLDTLGGAGEIDIAPARADGTTHRSTTIWIVRLGGDLYVRAYRGPNSSWYRAAARTRQGRVTARRAGYDINFEPARNVDRAQVDAAYRAKYGRSPYVDAMVTDAAAATTLLLTPTSDATEDQ